MHECLDEAKDILGKYHDFDKSFLSCGFDLFIQSDKPGVFAYIFQDAGIYRIGIHPAFKNKTGADS